MKFVLEVEVFVSVSLLRRSMKAFKCLFGVLVLLACAVTAHSHNKLFLPSQLPQQLKGPPSKIPFDKCQVEDDEKIQCGTPEISAEQCEYINCCFNEQQCYYGKAGLICCSLLVLEAVSQTIYGE